MSNEQGDIPAHEVRPNQEDKIKEEVVKPSSAMPEKTPDQVIMSENESEGKKAKWTIGEGSSPTIEALLNDPKRELRESKAKDFANEAVKHIMEGNHAEAFKVYGAEKQGEAYLHAKEQLGDKTTLSDEEASELHERFKESPREDVKAFLDTNTQLDDKSKAKVMGEKAETSGDESESPSEETLQLQANAEALQAVGATQLAEARAAVENESDPHEKKRKSLLLEQMEARMEKINKWLHPDDKKEWLYRSGKTAAIVAIIFLLIFIIEMNLINNMSGKGKN